MSKPIVQGNAYGVGPSWVEKAFESGERLQGVEEPLDLVAPFYDELTCQECGATCGAQNRTVEAHELIHAPGCANVALWAREQAEKVKRQAEALWDKVDKHSERLAEVRAEAKRSQIEHYQAVSRFGGARAPGKTGAQLDELSASLLEGPTHIYGLPYRRFRASTVLAALPIVRGR
jgi:hypothetical protein